MRTLVIRGGALGDFIVSLPTLRLLRDHEPQGHIELLGHPPLADAAIGRFYLDAARSVHHGPLSAFFMPRAVLDPAWMDYIGGFDLVLSYFYDPDGLFEANLQRCQPGRILTFTSRVPANFGAPAARHFAEILRPLGLQLGEDAASDLFPSPADLDGAHAFLSGMKPGTRVVAIHPGSGGENKIWPDAAWAEVGRRLCRENPDLVLLLVEGEADVEPARFLAEAWRDLPVVRARLLPLSILTALLHGAVLYLGHDSGVTHLAAASRRDLPVIALFGPTDSKIWAPPRAHVHVLQPGTTMAEITVDEVHARASALLKNPAS